MGACTPLTGWLTSTPAQPHLLLRRQGRNQGPLHRRLFLPQAGLEQGGLAGPRVAGRTTVGPSPPYYGGGVGLVPPQPPRRSLPSNPCLCSPCRGQPTHRRYLPFAASLCIHSPHAVDGEGGCAPPWANLPPLPHPSAPCACTGDRRPTLHMGHKARSGLSTPPPSAPAGRGAGPRVVDPHLVLLYFTHCSPMYSTTTLIPSYHS